MIMEEIIEKLIMRFSSQNRDLNKPHLSDLDLIKICDFIKENLIEKNKAKEIIRIAYDLGLRRDNTIDEYTNIEVINKRYYKDIKGLELMIDDND